MKFKYYTPGIEDFSKRARNNKDLLQHLGKAGCYHCVSIITFSTIEDWVDEQETALCPRCDIDALLPGETNKDVLHAGYNYWFSYFYSEE